jgi:hypothetical protein
LSVIQEGVYRGFAGVGFIPVSSINGCSTFCLPSRINDHPTIFDRSKIHFNISMQMRTVLPIIFHFCRIVSFPAEAQTRRRSIERYHNGLRKEARNASVTWKCSHSRSSRLSNFASHETSKYHHNRLFICKSVTGWLL